MDQSSEVGVGALGDFFEELQSHQDTQQELLTLKMALKVPYNST